MYTHGGFMSMYGKTNTVLLSKITNKITKKKKKKKIWVRGTSLVVQ